MKCLANILAFLFLVNVSYAQEKGLCLNPLFEQTVDSYLEYTVPTISVSSLAEHQEDYVILDARESEEYRVSHIPGALHIGYDRFDMENINDIKKDQAIVVYCSIGYRSEKIGEKLLDAGYEKVYNLYGSIFEWANRSLPLVIWNGNITTEIHTYNKSWSKWVNNPELDKVH
jgi:rhodanese-related sulfurtransferase